MEDGGNNAYFDLHAHPWSWISLILPTHLADYEQINTQGFWDAWWKNDLDRIHSNSQCDYHLDMCEV